MILTLKNLWTRRKQHVWLCVELVLISVVSWFVIDPLFVEVYDVYVEPDGFDTSSLCCLRPMNDYDNAWADPEPLEKDLNVIKNKILEMDEVESLCFETSWFLFSDVYQHSYVSLPGDTTKSCYGAVNWVIDVDNDYFKTYGYKVIAGNPNEEEGAIITRSVAEKLYGKTDVCGATISIWNASERRVEEYVDDKKIIAVIEDVKMGKNFNCRHSIFYRSKSRQFSAASRMWARWRRLIIWWSRIFVIVVTRAIFAAKSRSPSSLWSTSVWAPLALSGSRPANERRRLASAEVLELRRDASCASS